MVGRDDTLPLVVERNANRTGDRLFLEEVTGRTQTYAETHAAAQAWARAFRAAGVGPGDRVLAFMPTCIETVNVWIGLGWLRATQVPINTDFRGEMLRFVLENARASILVCASRWLEAVHDVADTLTELKTIVVYDAGDEILPTDGRFQLISGERFLADGPADGELEGPEPHDPGMMMYTSGTTGTSKGVLLPWANFANAGRHIGPPSEDLSADDILFSPFPMFHASGTWWLCAMANAGAKLILREKFSTDDYWDDIRRHSCTVTMLLGAMGNFVVRQPPRPDDADNPLRVVLLVPMLESVDEFERRFDVDTYTVYGMTELGIVTRSPSNRIDNASCGQARPDLEVRIMDSFDHEAPNGEVGEIAVRPHQPWTSFVGYFEMTEATRLSWQNLWFHTGDAARRDDAGNYYFVDRIKDAIRRRGENISSAEVEALVLRFDPILECAAVAAPSEWGEDEV